MNTRIEDRAAALTGADRQRRHRMRRKAREVQLAVGIARLVLGQAAGEQRNVVAEALERAVASGELPDDYAVLIDRALDRLRSRFNGR